MYEKRTKELVKDNQWKCLLHLILPKKKGRFICKYYCSLLTPDNQENKWCYCKLQLDSNRLMTSNWGLAVPKRMDSHSYGLPVSGSAIVELSGDETDQQRKLGFWHEGYSSHPSGIIDLCIEAYELE